MCVLLFSIVFDCILGIMSVRKYPFLWIHESSPMIIKSSRVPTYTYSGERLRGRTLGIMQPHAQSIGQKLGQKFEWRRNSR